MSTEPEATDPETLHITRERLQHSGERGHSSVQKPDYTQTDMMAGNSTVRDLFLCDTN